MTLVKIKEGLYVPEDFEKDHNYYADPEGKKKYTGVTTIIGVLAKPALIGWAAKEAVSFIEAKLRAREELTPEVLQEAKSAHTRKKEDAADFGTTAHAMIEMYVKNCLTLSEGVPLAGNEQAEPIKHFIDWAMQEVDHFLFSERRMADSELFIAGTSDFGVVLKDGKKLIGDYKTSSGIYGIDYFLQGAAYKLLAEKEGDESYDGVVIVRQGKKDPNDFEATYRYVPEDREAFLACLTLYRQQATFVKPQNKYGKFQGMR